MRMPAPTFDTEPLFYKNVRFVFSAKISSLAIGGRNVAELDFGTYFGKPFVDKVNILLIVENQICKFLIAMDKDKPVIVVSGAVVGLTFAYSGKAPVDILIWNIVFPPEIPVIKAQLSESYSADFLAGIEVVDVLGIAYVFFVNALESGLPKAKQRPHSLSLMISSEYHLSGRAFIITAPSEPPIKPTINPPTTSLGKCTTR